MGQSVSAPKAHHDLASFLNFPKEALDSLWTSYNLLGEGWGLNVDEMMAIFKGAEFVQSNYQFTDLQLRGLFRAFDTDNNGLIDALELFVTIALTSGMDTIDKIYFAFCAYDFDNAGSLSFDEATLLLRSVVQGLGKVSPSNVIFTSPNNKEIESFAELVFQHANKAAGSRTGSRVTTAEFKSYCSAHPVTSSWLKSVAQFPAETAATDLTVPLGDTAVLLGAAANQVAVKARHPQKSASVISEEDFLAIAAIKAVAEKEASRPKFNDILTKGDEEEEDEESQEARRVAEAAALAAAAANDPDAPVLPAWTKAVDLMKPEDAATEGRSDSPEDFFDPIWMTGVNTARTGSSDARSSAAPLMHRAVKYANMTLPPVPEAVPEGEEAAPVVIPTVLLGSAAAQLFVMKKDEEAGWSQRLFTQHASAITCLDVHYGKNLLVTAENNEGTGGSRVVLWNLETFSVITAINTRYGVKLIDISETGAYLLVVCTDLAATCTMYEVATGKVVFARPLLLGPRTVKDSITDVRFTGTAAMFAVSSVLQGVTFYVEEGGSFMGADGLKVYEERGGLYQAIGRPAVGAAVTELCRFDGTDELVAGTEKGQLLVWHGRTVAQLIEAHRTAVNAIDYNRNSLTLISGGADGVINIYTLAAAAASAPAKAKKSPQLIVPRMLELSATFDILRHDLCSYAIRSLSLSADCRRALLTTAACEVMEVALFITPPTPEEVAEAEALAEAENAARAEAQAAAAAAKEAAIAAGEAPAEGEGEKKEEVPFVSAVPSLERFLGDDVHKAPILTAHFSTSTGSAAQVTGVCRVPGAGFATCAADGTVRTWQGAGGNEETGATVYKTSKVVKMDSGCSAVDASAAAIAVALTGEPNKSRAGSVHLFSLPDMQFIAQFSEATQAITTLKFSPEGNLLVAASADGVLYVYQAVEGQWTHKGVCGANTVVAGAFATKLDFSSDGLYVRCYFPQTETFRLFDVSSPAFGRDLTDLSAVPPPPVKAAPVEGEEDAPPAAEDAGPSGPPLELLRSLAWASNSCAFNWDTKGAISLQLPGATDRFNHLLLTATATGAVAVERVPAAKYPAKKAHLDTSKLVTFSAHLGGVSALAFIEEGARLVTAGAQDGTLRVWKVTYDMDEYEPDPLVTGAAAASSEGAEEEELDEEGGVKAPKLEAIYDSGEDDDLLDTHRMKDHLSRDNNRKRVTMQAQKIEAEKKAEEAAVAAALAAAAAAQIAADAGIEAESVGGSGDVANDERPPAEPDLEVDKFSGVSKWGAHVGLTIDNMSADSTRALSAPPSLVPTDELELNWVYGCSARQTRGAVHYSREGTIVYPAGCLGVIYDKLTSSQVYSMPHADEITALDVHVTSGLAVSAHKGNGAISACVWNTADGSIRRYLDCGVVNGVSTIRFSPDASLVALTCQDQDHTVLIFSVSDGRLCARYRNGPKKPLCLAFSSAENNTTGTAPVRILQGGALHFKFLTFHPARSTIAGKTGSYGADVKKTNVNCVGALPLQPGADGAESTGNEFLMGMADGSIGVVAKGEYKASAFTPVMKGPITAMYVVKLKDGTPEEAPAYKVVVGGTNGLLKVLDQELQPVSEWNLYLNPYGLLPLGRVRGFKSLCVDKLNRKILYATAGGEVGEVELKTGVDVNKGPLVFAHFRDQLHALCAHPLRQECITAGDDKTLRVWHLDTKTMATFIDLPDIARTATYSPNGHLVVAGLGGEVPGNGRSPRLMRGKVVVISYLQGTLRLVHTAGDAKDNITTVLFTPDGSKLLASSLDGNVYIYDALNNFQLLLVLTGQHKEGIRSMDMSDNGQYVTTCGEYSEFFVWDLSTAAVVRPADRFEVLAATGLQWSVRQAPFGLNSVGVFPPFSDPADTLSLNQSKDHKLLAVGDSFGTLKLFRNPSTEFFAPYKKYACHSPGGVSKLAFTVKDQYLLSTGRYDRVMAQWKVIKSSDLPDQKLPPADLPIEVIPEEDYASTYVVKGVNFAEESLGRDDGASAAIKVQLSTILGPGTSSSTLPRALFFGQGDLITSNGRFPVLLDASGSGVQRLLFAPAEGSDASPYNNAAQQQVTALAVTPSGKFAAVGHVAPATADDNVTSRLVIVGAPSGVQVSELAADIPGGVTTCCFSEDGMICACLSGDAQHSMHVFRTYTGTWEDATLVSSTHVSAGSISLLGFIPAQASAAALAAYVDANAPPAVEGADAPVAPLSAAAAAAAAPVPVSYDLVTAGAGHIKFWRIKGQNLYCTCGEYGADVMSKPVFTALTTCLGGAYFRSQVVTGDSEGNLHFWRGGRKTTKLPAHHAAVTALKAFGSFSEAAPPALAVRKIVTSTSNIVRATSGFISGSNDKLLIWSTESDEATVTHSFSVQQLLSGCGWTSAIYLSDKLMSSNFITSIDNDPSCGRLVVAFSSSPIVTLAKDSKTVQKVTEGHSREASINAIVAHPTDSSVVLTAASDGMLRLWDVSSKTVVGAGGENATASNTLVGTLQTQHTPTAAVFLNATTLFVAVSGADTNGKSGSILVVTVHPNAFYNGTDSKFLMTVVARLHNVGTGALTQLRLSPTYKFLAASCSDGCAYVFRLEGVDSTGACAHPALSSAYAATGETKSADIAEALFMPLGFLLAHPSGAAVAGVDFTADERFARTFGENFAKYNGKVEVNFFDMSKAEGGDEGARVHAGTKLQDPAVIADMKTAFWASVSSPAASEVRGVNYTTRVVTDGENAGATATVLTAAQVSSVSCNASASAPLVCAAYEDGSLGVYRFPAYAAPAARSSRQVLDLGVHSAGSVLSTFTAADGSKKQAQRLVTIGRNDGSLMVWDIEG